MTKLNDLQLPPEMETALDQCIQALPDKTLAALGKHLPGGFTKPKLILENIRKLAKRPANLPVWLIDTVKEKLPLRLGIEDIAPEVLTERFDDFAAVTGPALFLLTLMTSDRAGLRKLGIDRLALASKAFTEEEKRAAAVRCAGWFLSRFGSMAGSVSKGTPVHPTIPDPPPAGQRRDSKPEDCTDKTLKDLRDKLQKERTARAEDNRKATAQWQAEKQRHADQLAKLTQALHEVELQKHSLDQQLVSERAEKAATIQSGVKEALNACERKWLANAVDLEQFLRSTTADHLISRVTHALEAQGHQDLHTGNRRHLQKRLGELRQAAHLLADASLNAINPLRELAPLREEVGHEIEAIEAKLGPAPNMDAFSRGLIDKIQNSTDFTGLRETSDLLERLGTLKLLGAQQQQQLHETLQRRNCILNSKHPAAPREETLHWLSLQGLIERNAECELLIDGHNVLFNLEVFASLLENGKPGEKTRQHLLLVVGQLQRNRPKLHTRIVFDGPVRSLEKIHPNLQLEYSGATGTNRADDVIINRLASKTLQNLNLRRFVVTDDRGLQQRVRQSDACYVPLGGFEAILRHFKCLSSVTAP